MRRQLDKAPGRRRVVSEVTVPRTQAAEVQVLSGRSTRGALGNNACKAVREARLTKERRGTAMHL